MSAKSRVSFKKIVEMGILPWTSWKTTKRKIVEDSFPAYFENGHYSFVPEEIEMWFKKRKASSAAS